MDILERVVSVVVFGSVLGELLEWEVWFDDRM